MKYLTYDGIRYVTTCYLLLTAAHVFRVWHLPQVVVKAIAPPFPPPYPVNLTLLPQVPHDASYSFCQVSSK